jgi:geranylgeranyl diphosphate synthase type I
LVETTLRAFVVEQAASVAAWDPALRPLVSAASAAILASGKRIRPTFAYWAWRGAAGPDAPAEPVIPALAALEMLHTFALVHDDIMDESTVRRGQPSAHRRMTDLHAARRWRGDGRRFGESAGILIGDLCLVWADQLIDQAGLAGAQRLAVRRCYDAMRVETVAGQFLDVLSEAVPDWPIERALLTARLKTASYTVTRPLLYGAALAGDVSTNTAERYARFGTAVGVAFQLRDDLLGLYGEAGAIGKGLGDDLARAKPTVLLQTARAMANRRQAARLEREVRPRWRAQNVARIARLITETGAPQRLEQMIAAYIAHAREALHDVSLHPPVRQALESLATAAAWRAA